MAPFASKTILNDLQTELKWTIEAENDVKHVFPPGAKFLVNESQESVMNP
jgi:hypothetical protein